MNTILKNWKTTVVGVMALLLTVLPPVKSWIETTTHITPVAMLGLVIALLGVLAKDHNITGV